MTVEKRASQRARGFAAPPPNQYELHKAFILFGREEAEQCAQIAEKEATGADAAKAIRAAYPNNPFPPRETKQ